MNYEKYMPSLRARKKIMEKIGIEEIDELFKDIPETVRIDKLNLPKPISEMEIEKEIKKILEEVYVCPEKNFASCGILHIYIPAVIDEIISRGEFYTSYTPYQPEISQGMLQALFEYQSMICELTGLDVANCSMYDGYTALGEAALMCKRIKRKKYFLIPSAIHPEKKSVLRNYAKCANIEIVELAFDNKVGKTLIDTDIDKSEVSGIYIENPNFFGVWEDCILDVSKEYPDAIFVYGGNPLALSITISPDEIGAEIYVSEGQSLGLYPSFGGPYLGIFACAKKYVRSMPGRLIGMTEDSNGERAFCMTLQTREQHIRRGKATSNICSNEALCGIAVAAYMAHMGPSGMIRLCKDLIYKSHVLSNKLNALDKIKSPLFDSDFFFEFVISCDLSSYEKMLNVGYQFGTPLKKYFPMLGDSILIGVNQYHTLKIIDDLITDLMEVM